MIIPDISLVRPHACLHTPVYTDIHSAYLNTHPSISLKSSSRLGVVHACNSRIREAETRLSSLGLAWALDNSGRSCSGKKKKGKGKVVAHIASRTLSESMWPQ